MNLGRRQLIAGIGKAICAGMTVPFLPKLVGGDSVIEFHAGIDWGHESYSVIVGSKTVISVPKDGKPTLIDDSKAHHEVEFLEIIQKPKKIQDYCHSNESLVFGQQAEFKAKIKGSVKDFKISCLGDSTIQGKLSNESPSRIRSIKET